MDLTPGPGEDQKLSEVYAAAGKAMAALGATENYEPELFEWHHCATGPNADGPCACSGAPWPSSDVRAALDLAYGAGRKDAARDIQPAARRLVARIIANAHLLDVPFTDAPDRSPWTQMKPAMYALFDAVGIKFAEVNQPRTVQEGVSGDTSSGTEVER